MQGMTVTVVVLFFRKPVHVYTFFFKLNISSTVLIVHFTLLINFCKSSRVSVKQVSGTLSERNEFMGRGEAFAKQAFAAMLP